MIVYKKVCDFRIAVFSADDAWIRSMDTKLPDVLFFHELPKGNPEVLRTADTIRIQPKDMSYDDYQRIIVEAGKADTSRRQNRMMVL